MDSIDLHNCGIGTVSSREDGSVKLSIVTAELRPSEAGLLMQYHGKAARVLIAPHGDTAGAVVQVATERGQKTPSQRLHAVLFLLFKQSGGEGDFETFYRREMEKYIDHVKAKLNP